MQFSSSASFFCCAAAALLLSSCEQNAPAPGAPQSAAQSAVRTPGAPTGEAARPVVKVPFQDQLLDPALVRRYLTGGSSRTWTLDNLVASAITVGIEASPSSYYLGGPAGSLPPCQADDEYTFTTSNTLIYNARAETFVAGVYACQAPRSLTTAYAYGPATGAGLAQLVLATPGSFIGATDASANRIYRIMSISDREMVLRGGAATDDPVFTFRLRVK